MSRFLRNSRSSSSRYLSDAPANLSEVCSSEKHALVLRACCRNSAPLLRLAVMVAATLLSPVLIVAGDWPQILGPTRDGVAQKETLSDSWPKAGPPTLWERPVGDGFSGVAVVGEKAIVFHREGDKDIAEALDVTTGKTGWSYSVPSDYQPSFTNDAGPRAVPLIHDGKVYLYGARGLLSCVALSNGNLVWKRDLYAEYSSKRPFKGDPPEGYFGFGSTPIVEGNKLLLNVGGDTQEAGIVAFDLATGKTLWKSTTERASYSSPVAATIDGKRQVIFATRLKLLSVDPDNGKELWSIPFGRLGPAVTAANPVVVGSRVLITASYGFGATSVRVTKSGATLEWNSDEFLSSQYTTPIELKGWLYGVHGRQDVGSASIRRFDVVNQKAHEVRSNFGYATLIRSEDKLLFLKTDGELVLMRPNGGELDELASAKLFPSGSTCRALPALSNGRLFVRDERKLKCVALK